MLYLSMDLDHAPYGGGNALSFLCVVSQQGLQGCQQEAWFGGNSCEGSKSTGMQYLQFCCGYFMVQAVRQALQHNASLIVYLTTASKMIVIATILCCVKMNTLVHNSSWGSN